MGRNQKIGLRLAALVCFLAVGVAFQNCAPLKCVTAAPSATAGTPITSSGSSSGSSSSSSSSVASSADCPKSSTAASSASPAPNSTSGTRAPSSTGNYGGSGSSGGGVVLPPVTGGTGNYGGGSTGSGFPGSTGSGTGGTGPIGSGTGTGLPSNSGLYMFTLDLKDTQISNGVVDSDSESRVYFSVSVQGGYSPLTYKWFKDGVALTAAQVSAGSSLDGTSISLDASIPNVLGEYYVEVRDVTARLITSKKAKLTQLPQDCREEYFFALDNSSSLESITAQTYDVTPLINRTKAFYKDNTDAYAVSQRNWFPNQLRPDSETGEWAAKGLYRGSNKFPAAKYDQVIEFPNCNVYFGKDHHVPVARPDRINLFKQVFSDECDYTDGPAFLNKSSNLAYGGHCYRTSEMIFDCRASSINVRDQYSACFANGVAEETTERRNYSYTGSIKYQCKGNRWKKIADTCTWVQK